MKRLFTIGIIVLSCLFSSCTPIEDYNTYTAIIKCANFTDQNISVKASTDYRPANINQVKKSVPSKTEEPESVIEISWIPGKKYVDIDGFTSSYKVKFQYYFENGNKIPDIDSDDKVFTFKHDGNYEVVLAFLDSRLPKKIDLTSWSEEKREEFMKNQTLLDKLYTRDYLTDDSIVYDLDNYFFNFQEEEILKVDETAKQLESIFEKEDLLESKSSTILFKMIK